MCHTLLQYYIHCGHSNVVFYPCLPYLGKNSSHSPLHPNYIDPSPKPLQNRGIFDGGPLPSWFGAGAVDHRGRLSAWGPGRPGPPAYAVVRSLRGCNGKDDDSGGDGVQDSAFVPSEWRDHGKPRGVAHSYHRPCPECVQAKADRAETAVREGEGGDRDANAVCAWQRAAESGVLAEESVVGEDEEHNDGDVSFREVAEAGSGMTRSTRGGQAHPDLDRRDAVVTLDRNEYAAVGLISEGRPRQRGQSEAGIQRPGGQRDNNTTIITNVPTPRETPSSSNPDTMAAVQGSQGVDLGQDSLRELNQQSRMIQRIDEVANGERSWDWGVRDAAGAELPEILSGSPQVSAQPFEVATARSTLPAHSIARPIAADQVERSSSTFPASGQNLQSTRRESTGRVDGVSGIVGRMRQWNAARRIRRGSEAYQYRATSSAGQDSSLTLESGRLAAPRIVDDRELGAPGRLFHTTRVVVAAPPVATESTATVDRAATQPPPDPTSLPRSARSDDQDRADRFMWPLLFLQPDPRLDPTRNPVTGMPFRWANEDRYEQFDAIDMLYQLIFYHGLVGYDIGEMTVRATADLLPWYRRLTPTEEQAANRAFLHMSYISRWGQRYGRSRFFELVERNPGATRDELADAIVRAMAITEQERVEQWESGETHPSRGESSLVSTNLSSTVRPAPTAATLESDRRSSATGRRPILRTEERITYYQAYSLRGDDVFENIRARRSVAWDSEDAGVNRVLFRHFWEHASTSQFDQWIEGQVDLGRILRTEEGQGALAHIISPEQGRAGVPGHGGLLARLISMSGHTQLEILSPSGRVASFSWADLNSEAPTSHHRDRITEGILGLIQAELNAVRDAMYQGAVRRAESTLVENHINSTSSDEGRTSWDPEAPYMSSGSSSRRVQRQLRDGAGHRSEGTFDRDWPILCNDATHSRRAEHRHPDKDLLRSIQHYRRRNWSKKHGKRPYPADNRREHLTDHTCEILVNFSGCGHSNAIFVEKLNEDEKQNVIAQCGCHSFDSCLTSHRKARSAQVCLECQMEALLSVESLDGHQVRELTEWFSRQIRAVRKQRDIALWPFGARNTDIADPKAE